MSTVRRLAPFAASFLAYVAFLHWADGPWKRWKQGREPAVLDPWSWTHLAWGYAARRQGVGFGELLVLGLANEAVEAWASRHRPDLLWGESDVPLNSVADVALNQAGWLLAGEGS